MLLRNAPSPQDRDHDIFLTMTSHTPAAQDIPGTNTTNYTDNNNDTNGVHENNSLDDIWGTTPPQTHHHHHHHFAQDHHHHNHHHSYHPYQDHQQQHPSDIPRLAQSHSTAGYRDGITLAKARTAQAGFDEGYGLGATIGARAGQLLGVLEGLAAAVGLHSLSSASSEWPGQRGREEAARLGVLLAEARRELSVRGGIFGGEFFWEGDGNWRFAVGDGEGGDGAVVFADVAEAHPLVRKWDGIVRAEAERYGVDWEVLKDEVGREDGDAGEEEEERVIGGRARRDAGSSAKPAARGGGQLAW